MREYARTKGVDAEAALTAGVAAEEFRAAGSAIYQKVGALGVGGQR